MGTPHHTVVWHRAMLKNIYNIFRSVHLLTIRKKILPWSHRNNLQSHCTLGKQTCRPCGKGGKSTEKSRAFKNNRKLPICTRKYCKKFLWSYIVPMVYADVFKNWAENGNHYFNRKNVSVLYPLRPMFPSARQQTQPPTEDSPIHLLRQSYPMGDIILPIPEFEKLKKAACLTHMTAWIIDFSCCFTIAGGHLRHLQSTLYISKADKFFCFRFSHIKNNPCSEAWNRGCLTV